MPIPLKSASPSILPTVSYAAARCEESMIAAAILALDPFGAPVEFIWNVARKPDGWAWPDGIASTTTVDRLFQTLCRELANEPSLLLLEAESELLEPVRRLGLLLPAAILGANGEIDWIGQAPFPNTTPISLAEGIVAQLGVEPFRRLETGLEEQKPWSLDEDQVP